MQWKQKRTSQRLAAVAGVTLALAVGALGFAPRVWAQANSGTLAGRVVDKSGAALPGVTVTAVQKDTGYERNTVTGPDGAFRLPSVQVGTYAVKADLAGFGTVTVDAVQVDVASIRNLEITLAQSAVQESITVVDEAPLIANTPAVGAVVSQQELDNLPLNGRQFANLAVLAPGTSPASWWSSSTAASAATSTTPSTAATTPTTRSAARCRTSASKASRSSRSRPWSTRPSSAVRPAACCRW